MKVESRLGRGVLSFLLLQVGWFAAVGGAARGLYWLGPAVVLLLVAFHLRAAVDRRRELELLVALTLVGTALDSLQSCLGLLSFRGAASPCLAPLWISTLWLHFATTVRGPLAGLRGRPVFSFVLGALGAPIAYAAGVRLGAAQFHPQAWRSAISIALVWGFALPAAVAFGHRKAKEPATS